MRVVDRPGGTGRADAGVATVWTAVAVAALVSVAALVFLLGAATTARHRLEAAADLGALAAASHAAEGPARACERARWVAEHMSAVVVSCRWERRDALVEVHSSAAGRAAWFPSPSARARAGPVDRPP
ncbi:Rv3654c family TadE-like protein [Amycolatopsis sp. NPDC059021]|uniref:Rv3654c family TadE-like protein n=1 Tax=Amycolatopsis sp. NPDC059021 TaxID=3346704 RepID=UPI00366B47BF